jgi:hypothetical protein
MDWRRNVVYAVVIIPLTITILVLVYGILPSIGEIVSYVITAAMGPFVAAILFYITKPFLDPLLDRWIENTDSDETEPDAADSDEPEPIRILFFGRSRVGKSTWLFGISRGKSKM